MAGRKPMATRPSPDRQQCNQNIGGFDWAFYSPAGRRITGIVYNDTNGNGDARQPAKRRAFPAKNVTWT